MPVVLAPEAWPAWLGEQPAEEAQLKSLLVPYPSEGMIAWPFFVCRRKIEMSPGVQS
jgi:putative SOS response-associated peptidase YedK